MRVTPIKLETDGRFVTDVGWTKVPKIGATFAELIGKEPQKPILAIDDMPVRVPLKFNNGEAGVIIEPPAPAVDVIFHPLAAAANEKGFIVRGKLQFIAADSIDSPKERNRQRRALEEAIKDIGYPSPVECPGKRSIRVHTGGIEIGSNNEIVKLLVQLGKLPDAALQELKRIAGEVSPEKIEEWIKYPEESFRRSDVGKHLENVQKDLTEGPGDSNDVVGKDGWLRKRLGF